MTPQVQLRQFRAEDADWLVEKHADLYANDEGFDATFGPLVADIVTGFLQNHDPRLERGWIAESAGQRLGSIFCVRLTDETAKLRLFMVLPEARGQQVGLKLLKTCMQFAQDNGYHGMQLWTHESHKAACALYAANGWSLSASKPVHSFGVDLVEQSWGIQFQSVSRKI